MLRLWPFLAAQSLIYIDRGVLPSCTREIDRFIQFDTGTKQPDVYLGFLQSAFIVGLSISAPLLAHRAIQGSSPLRLIAYGMLVWLLGELLTPFALLIGETQVGPPRLGYFIFLSARALTGAGEASIISLVPPLILQHGGAATALWLGVFSAVIPVGVAGGYIYGSFIVPLAGWPSAYVLLGLVSLPFTAYWLRLSSTSGLSTETLSPFVSNQGDSFPSNEGNRAALWYHFKGLLSNRTYFWLCVASSAYVATVAAFSTFGPAFLIDTELAQSEPAAASAMGLVVGTAGVIGSLLGGYIVRHVDVSKWLIACHDIPPSFRRPLVEVRPSNPLSDVLEPFVRVSSPFLPTSTHETSYSTPRKEDNTSSRTASPGHLHGAGGRVVPNSPDEMIDDGSSEIVVFTRANDGDILEDYDLAGTTGTAPIKVLNIVAKTIFVTLAIFLAIPWVSSRFYFLSLLGLGLTLLFAAQVSFNLCGMLCVEASLRPLAVGVMTLFLHFTGDVPSPILVGLLKDRLAPHCVASIVSVEAPLLPTGPSAMCLNEQSGVKITEFICGSWLLWVLVGTLRARACWPSYSSPDG